MSLRSVESDYRLPPFPTAQIRVESDYRLPPFPTAQIRVSHAPVCFIANLWISGLLKVEAVDCNFASFNTPHHLSQVRIFYEAFRLHESFQAC